MARLQILQLPEGAGDERPPFILVIDQVGDAETERLVESQEATNGIAKKVGARAVAVFHGMTVDIPANDPAAYVERSEPSGEDNRARQAEAKMKAAFDVAASFEAQRDEARQWARHGYEIGQRHCGWSDHGVAPDWLTEGWPRAFDSCEHLKQMAEFDEALSRVRALPTEPEIMNAQQEHPSVWRHGYHCGVLAAKAAIRPRNEPANGG